MLSHLKWVGHPRPRSQPLTCLPVALLPCPPAYSARSAHARNGPTHYPFPGFPVYTPFQWQWSHQYPSHFTLFLTTFSGLTKLAHFVLIVGSSSPVHMSTWLPVYLVPCPQRNEGPAKKQTTWIPAHPDTWVQVVVFPCLCAGPNSTVATISASR